VILKGLVIVNSKYETLDSAAPHTKAFTTRDDPSQSLSDNSSSMSSVQPALREVHAWADQDASV
jgi:hypothetical protein